MNLSQRFHSERKRLGFTQEAFATLGGVSKRTYCNYESGDRECGADMHSKLAKVGLDVQFVIVGIRSANLSAIAQQSKAGSPDPSETGAIDAKLSARAISFLGNYESCTDPMRDAIDKTLCALAGRDTRAMALGVWEIQESLFVETI